MLKYKVVTSDLQSLGLRKNPNIMTFPIKKWVKLGKEDIKWGKDDWGGIWVAQSLSGARGLQKYMKRKYNKNVKIFSCEIGEVLFENSYRVKTNKVKLLDEI